MAESIFLLTFILTLKALVLNRQHKEAMPFTLQKL